MTTTVNRAQVEERLIELLVSMGPERSDIRPEATLEELDIDSLDLVELGQVAEEEFGVTLEVEHLKDVKTVQDALDAVATRLA